MENQTQPSSAKAQNSWEQMTVEEKKVQLFLNQKQTLDMFLKTGAITQTQYQKSLGDLREKMGITCD
jgi:hypothetical protein